ncbi:MAG: nuclear transport factor 2 family protein [Actinobacteria bacterium]|nr:nuclear transport factor 2 family protein [Actinomycetota bacterium]
MNDVDRMLAERACERVVVATAVCNDQRDWAGLAQQYTPDGVVVRPNGQRVDGRAAIEAAYGAGPPERVTRHLCSNMRVEVDGPDSARVETVVLIVSGTRSDDPDATFGVLPSLRHSVGEFADRLVRTDEGWKIAERHARIVMNT